MRPILTIAVPTYNRAETLKQSIENTMKYYVPDKMELFISDNASTDNTSEVVYEIIKKYPFIKYYKNEYNTGFDGNFSNCFDKAQGEYILLLSDDDFLLPGSINSILSILEQKPSFVHLNSSPLLEKSTLKHGKPIMKEEGIIIFDDKNDFVEKIGIFITFVSSLIFKVDLVKQIKEKEKYKNTSILQAHIALDIIRRGRNYVINTQNCVAGTKNDRVSYDVYEVWVHQLWRLFCETAFNCGYDHSRMSRIYKKCIQTVVLDFVMHFRRTCNNSNSWNEQLLWVFLPEDKSIRKMYKIALKCPKLLLPVYAKLVHLTRWCGLKG